MQFVVNMKQTIKEKIRQRRAQMLVHSCLYYYMSESIITDDTWQEWADELEQLQTKNPKQCNIKFFDKEFKDWTGATGAHLPHTNSWVIAKSEYILKLTKEKL